MANENTVYESGQLLRNYLLSGDVVVGDDGDGRLWIEGAEYTPGDRHIVCDAPDSYQDIEPMFDRIALALNATRDLSDVELRRMISDRDNG